MSIWFVTGASRGLGAEIVTAALAAGHSVVATGRSSEAVATRFADGDAERFLAVALDVTDPSAIAAAVDAAIARFGRIDVLVNNAGQGMVGAIEEVSDAETRSLLETNLFGVLAVTRAVLPVLRAQRSGHVVAVSSYGGFTQPGGGFGIYGASKFAVEAVHEALANEVRGLGIGVTIVEPGSFRTEFLAASSVRVAERRIEDYASFMDGARAYASAGGGDQPGDPTKGARAIVRFVDEGRTELRLPLGDDAFEAISAKLARVAADLDGVAELGRATSF
jgi:NAD(P)-dependent dehydrogenase (short-subunit alcohol dehydrogenase family)